MGYVEELFHHAGYVREFLKKRLHTSDIFLSQLKYKFITDFEYFLRQHKPIDHHKPMGNNTVMKHIERLRKMINVAIRMEWLDRDPFVAFQQKFERVERGFLSKENLPLLKTVNSKLCVFNSMGVRCFCLQLLYWPCLH